jgi:hypothetical protein
VIDKHPDHDPRHCGSHEQVERRHGDQDPPLPDRRDEPDGEDHDQDRDDEREKEHGSAARVRGLLWRADWQLEGGPGWTRAQTPRVYERRGGGARISPGRGMGCPPMGAA